MRSTRSRFQPAIIVSTLAWRSDSSLWASDSLDSGATCSARSCAAARAVSRSTIRSTWSLIFRSRASCASAATVAVSSASCSCRSSSRTRVSKMCRCRTSSSHSSRFVASSSFSRCWAWRMSSARSSSHKLCFRRISASSSHSRSYSAIGTA